MLASTKVIRQLVRNLNGKRAWVKSYTDLHSNPSLRRLCLKVANPEKTLKELQFVMGCLGYTNTVSVSKNGYIRAVASF